MERPFIIYTLRRTGGTSLAAFMANISSYPTVEHEPFNRERRWGAITADLEKGMNRQDLRERIAEVLEPRPNIKHCVEVVPVAIARTLIDLCRERDYAQFVLHRRGEKERLMSLYLAMATGAWGPRDAARIYPQLRSGERKPEPIDLKRVAERVRVDAAFLGETLMRLRAQNIDFGWLVFEEIYADPAATISAALAVARRMGLTIMPDDPRLSVFSTASGQGSGDVISLVPQAAELQRLLANLLD